MGDKITYKNCSQSYKCSDVQFQFEVETGLIRSVAFAEYCMTFAPNDQTIFALETCDLTNSIQAFTFETDTGWIKSSVEKTKCLAVEGESRLAGPFMSRELTLLPCADTPERFIKWVVLP